MYVNGNGRHIINLSIVRMHLALALCQCDPRPHITSFRGVYIMQSAQMASIGVGLTVALERTICSWFNMLEIALALSHSSILTTIG